MNPKQKKSSHAPKKKTMMVSKYTEPIQPPVADPDPPEMQITMVPPQGIRQVRKLAQEVHESRVENRRQFSNIEELLDERDHHLFEELSQLIHHHHHELHVENRKLRASIEDLLGVLDRHLLHWFKQLQERLHQHAEHEGDKLRRSVETRLTQLERGVAERLNQHDRDVEDALNRLTESLEQPEVEEETDEAFTPEEASYFKLGDRINVFVGGVQIDGTGSFVSMNDEVLIWFDSSAQIRFQSLIDNAVSIQRA